MADQSKKRKGSNGLTNPQVNRPDGEDEGSDLNR